MAALDALDGGARPDLLITRANFEPGKVNGAALARMIKLKCPACAVLFIALPENRPYLTNVGEFLPLPVGREALTAAIERLLASKKEVSHLVATMSRIVSMTYRYKPPPKRKGGTLAEITVPAVVVGKRGRRRPVVKNAAAEVMGIHYRPPSQGVTPSPAHRSNASVTLSAADGQAHGHRGGLARDQGPRRPDDA